MSNDRINFTTPVGRFVNGNLYVPQTKDADGKPLIIKNGPNAGQPTQKFYLAIAIPKIAGQHWATYPRAAHRPTEMSWGEAIWATGHKAFGPTAQSPAFAWKVTDGDSVVPNRKGRIPKDNEGWPGHWVLHCSGSYAPKCYNSDGSAVLVERDAIKPGYYIQIAGNVAGNASTQTPGVYINPSMVSLQGFGAEIISGPDPSQAGFGGVPLPAGASTVPVGGFHVGTAPAVATGMAPPPPAAPAAATAYVAPPMVPVVPNPQFLAPPAAPGAPVPAFAPPVAPVAPPAGPAGPVMLPAAGGHSYAALRAAGWTDDALRAAKMIA